MGFSPEIIATFQATMTLIILAGTLYGFIREKLPPDVTALLALLALLLTGVLTPYEAFAGFSHPATISVAAVLVLSAGLERTGALAFLARRVLAPIGHSEWFLTLVLMAAIGFLSAFINNTAAVAVFIPVVLDVCRRTGAHPGRLLMPMAFAATMGGLCTLIGTSTNLVAHEYAVFAGLPGFSMFELGNVGIPMLIGGFLYILVIGRWFLPKGPVHDAAPPERLGSYVSEMVVLPGSPWVGRIAKPGPFQRDHDLELIEVMRGRDILMENEPHPKLEIGDRLRVRGPLENLLAFVAREKLEMRRPGVADATVGAEGSKAAASAASASARPDPASGAVAGEGGASPPGPSAGSAPEPEVRATTAASEDPRRLVQLPLSEMVVLPGSPLIGRSLRSLRFAERYKAVVLGLHRPGETVSERPGNVPIRAGDVLVVEGEGEALKALAETPGFMVVGKPELPDLRPRKLLTAVLTLAGVVLVVSLGVLPIVTAATAGCAVLILARCIGPRQAYAAIDWRVIFVIAGTLALGAALHKTGITASVGHALASLTHVTGPAAVIAAFLVATSLLSQVISNAGTAALLVPVAVESAIQMGINPMAMVAAVTFGASASFATPIGYQTNLMVYGPGGYRFTDFVRLGLPLNILLMLIAMILIPRYWPL